MKTYKVTQDMFLINNQLFRQHNEDEALLKKGGYAWECICTYFVSQGPKTCRSSIFSFFLLNNSLHFYC